MNNYDYLRTLDETSKEFFISSWTPHVPTLLKFADWLNEECEEEIVLTPHEKEALKWAFSGGFVEFFRDKENLLFSQGDELFALGGTKVDCLLTAPWVTRKPMNIEGLLGGFTDKCRVVLEKNMGEDDTEVLG